jgi:hypothetical protein
VGVMPHPPKSGFRLNLILQIAAAPPKINSREKNTNGKN